MEIGRVVGNIWATKKDVNLNGQKLLVLKIIKAHEEEREDYLVAADIVGAGAGDLVLVSHGSAARYAVGNAKAPIDTAIVGIIDSIEIDDK